MGTAPVGSGRDTQFSPFKILPEAQTQQGYQETGQWACGSPVQGRCQLALGEGGRTGLVPEPHNIVCSGFCPDFGRTGPSGAKRIGPKDLL